MSLLVSCEKEPEPQPGPEPEPVTEFSPVVASMVSSLEQYYHPLSAAPLEWQDEDLSFLDDISGSKVVAMGEASHGTAEFFEAKFRVFRYLVEQQGYRVFAIEADMGECMIINEAIEGQKELEMVEVANIMKETMLFWTWKTREVRDMLLWMNSFNQGREEGDRIRYVGMDCQLNHYSADLLQEYLMETGFPCMSLADTLLNRLVEETLMDIEDITGEYYTGKYYERDLLEEQELRDSMWYYRDRLIAASDEITFDMYFHLAEVITQATEVKQLGYTVNPVRGLYVIILTLFLPVSVVALDRGEVQDTSIRFMVLGDTHHSSPSPDFGQTILYEIAMAAIGEEVDFVFFAGDLVVRGSDSPEEEEAMLRDLHSNLPCPIA